MHTSDTEAIYNYRPIGAAELHPRSLAVLDGSVYLGTTDSRLYRLVGWTSG